MLTNCNALSANRLKVASQEFKRHTQLLLDMKKDLEYIFKKIRAIKTKLSSQYPEAYKVAVAASFANKKPLAEEDEEDIKPPAPKAESRMVPTVSTETLKPSSSLSDDKRKAKKRPEGEKSGVNKNDSSDGVAGGEKFVKRRNSSSSDTESEASSGDSSTDTG